MKFNFDDLVERNYSNCEKFDGLEKKFGVSDIFPMWVADMDFSLFQELQSTLSNRANHPIYGYPILDDSYFDSIINWLKRDNFEVQRDEILYSPSVVTSLNISIRAFSKKNQKIIIQSPIYPPFFNSILNNQREVLDSRLFIENGKYRFNLDKNLKKAKIFMLCNPHNPTGRVFTKDELIEIGEFALKNSMIIVSDEIHSNLTLNKNRHTPIASISKEFSDITITLNSASKSFNVAGLSHSYLIIQNRALRVKFQKELKKIALHPNIFGILATKKAYESGEVWLNELRSYLESNVNLVDNFLKRYIPKIKFIQPEATYLLWLDFRELNYEHQKIKKMLLYDVKVGFNDGLEFRGDEGFFRMNIATSKSNILKILEELQRVFG